MKTKITSISILLIICSSCLFAQTNVQVTVKNIKETSGTIRVGIFSNENDFLKKATESKIVKVNGKEATILFTNIKPGDYAISVIHDINENGSLDKNFMGIPNEPYGFSNNAMGRFGPPSFEAAKVMITATTELSIQLR